MQGTPGRSGGETYYPQTLSELLLTPFAPTLNWFRREGGLPQVYIKNRPATALTEAERDYERAPARRRAQNLRSIRTGSGLSSWERQMLPPGSLGSMSPAEPESGADDTPDWASIIAAMEGRRPG